MFMLLRFTENIPKMWVIQTFLSAVINEEYRLCARSISLILMCSAAKAYVILTTINDTSYS